jgi:N-acyl amino acid synthase of PEP-CTERM/exosortase system
MAPALLRLLERFGLIFQRLGPAIDYHGMRQPVIANCETLLQGMAARHAEYYELIESTYHGK